MKEKTLTIIILVLAYIIFPIGAGYIIGKLFYES